MDSPLFLFSVELYYYLRLRLARNKICYYYTLCTVTKYNL